jgi:hypothetical protein
MTNDEFIKDTIEYYCTDSNRIAELGPLYKWGGCYCAVGRWIKPEKYCNAMESHPNVESLLQTYPDCLMDEVKDVAVEVLSVMQQMHDVVLARHYSNEQNRQKAMVFLERRGITI